MTNNVLDWGNDKNKKIEISVMRECRPFVPTSVLKLPSHREARDLRKPKLQDTRKEGQELVDCAPKDLKKKIKSYRKKESTANFDHELAKFILKYYARDSKTVFDPFSGWGERGYAAKLLKYDYIGYDISPKANDYAFATYGIKNNTGDSRNVFLDDKSIDFSYTCPPYFDLEKYESTDGQLTDIRDYKDFLDELEKVIQETNRILKTNGLVCWVVGDFRRKGVLIDFSTDVGLLFRKNGFELKDKVIIDNSTNYNVPLHLPNSYEHKFTVKVHETMWVFKKVRDVKEFKVDDEPDTKEGQSHHIMYKKNVTEEWGDWNI